MPTSYSDIIRLLSIPGVGPRKSLDLHRKFDSLAAIFHATSKELQEIPGINYKIAQAIHALPEKKLLAGQEKLLDKFNVELITIWDDSYPDLLRQIYDPPPVLFCRGDVHLLNRKCISIVGTRTPTHYGREIVREFSYELSNRLFTVVSGAARGIDTAAHESALKGRGSTIAVLGNGIDRVYPAENRQLYHELGKHGLLVSEFLMGTKPDAPNFPRRNRIISGLSVGTLVIEAAQKSGSLITAYFALDQNREVYATPGRITSRQSHGTNQLIRQGATLVGNVNDILKELDEKYQLGRSTGQQELSISLDPKESIIFQHLSPDDDIHIDALATMTGQTTFALLGCLLQMEMKGLVQQLPGKYFKRKV